MFPSPVEDGESGVFATEMGYCASVHGEIVHPSCGMNSKLIYSFHYRNSCDLTNAF